VTDFVLPYDAFLRTVRENTDIAHTFLLGAGASVNSGIPSASDCIWEWKKNIFISNNPNLANQYKEFKSETVQKSIQRWLDNEGIYPPLNSPEEYSFYASKAYPIDEIRRKYFENICKGKEPYTGYKLLCLLAELGMVHSVFTTNFDGLMEKAAHQMGITPIAVSLDSPGRIHRMFVKGELLCVELHGDYKFGPLKNTDVELDTQHETFVEALKQHLYDKHLVVMGYSGRDRSLMDAIKKAYGAIGPGMLFWCGYGDQINPEIKGLLAAINQTGRKAYFVPTEGFDTTLIHIAKTCFETNQILKDKATKVLQEIKSTKWVKTPFVMDVTATNALIKSNLFPVSLPKELFQFHVEFEKDARIWTVIKTIISGKEITAAPLKNMVYAFGTQNDLHDCFGNMIKGEIQRTPVTLSEIKNGSIFKELYLKTIIKALCKTFDLQTDGFEKVWRATDHKPINYGGKSYECFDAVELSLFFDNNIYGYLSILPTFYLSSIDKSEIPKGVIHDVGLNYYNEMLLGQPNVKFEQLIEKWKLRLFPNKIRLQFEYPINSGTGFKFSISPDTMHVKIMKAGNNRFPLILPKEFDKRTILHSGIQ